MFEIRILKCEFRNSQVYNTFGYYQQIEHPFWHDVFACNMTIAMAYYVSTSKRKSEIEDCFYVSFPETVDDTVLSLLEAPGAKILPRALLFRAICAYSVLLTHDNLLQAHPIKQVVVPAIVILSNIFRAWTMYVCMNSVEFLLEAPGASTLWGCYYFVTTCRPIWGRF